MIDAPEPPQIVIVQTERHNIREEAIERVARQLALADGKNPDQDQRCSWQGNPALGGSATCTLEVYAKPLWEAYRDRAEKMLKETFH